ncbi:MAG: hypothetical protein HMLKMBBP_03708 [Planctomycetes bacterium]|nr:hypothetical protein [Planctomycetota bacterium]
MTDPVVPQMITLAREARDLTQSELAARIDASQSKVSKHEAGLVAVSEADVEKYAVALGFPPAFFRTNYVRVGAGNDVFHHRKRQAALVSRLRHRHAEVDVRRLHVQRLLYDVEIDVRGFPAMDVDAFDGDVEFIAAQVRASWGLAPGPVHNLAKVVEDAGALVLQHDFGVDPIDAISNWVPGMPPVVCLNVRAPGDRQRLSLAHEVGHLVMHRQPGSADPEAEAQAFAGALLMPAAEFLNEFPADATLQRVLALKPRWRVSVQAMVVRAHQLGRLPKSRYQDLFRQMSGMGWRKDEPLPVAPEQPSLLKEVVALHIRQHGYSIPELAARALASEQEFRDLVLQERPIVRPLRPLRLERP